jgi:hypothetical protein
MTLRPATAPPTPSCPGQDHREIKRRLVGYVARQLFQLLEREAGSRFVV